jgi:hypothetical protein
MGLGNPDTFLVDHSPIPSLSGIVASDTLPYKLHDFFFTTENQHAKLTVCLHILLTSMCSVTRLTATRYYTLPTANPKTLMSSNYTQSYDPSNLRDLILSVLHADGQQQEDAVDVQQLFEELMLSKHHLVKLFDFGSRSDQERKEIEGGEFSSFLFHCFTASTFASNMF